MTRRQARAIERLLHRLGLGLLVGYFTLALGLGAVLVDMGWNWF